MSGDIPTMTQACAPPPDLQSVESDHSSSSGSQDPPPGAELLAKAVEQQNELGWTQFHQGRVSMLLAAVYYELNLGCQKSIGKSFWATNAERSILHYSYCFGNTDVRSFMGVRSKKHDGLKPLISMPQSLRPMRSSGRITFSSWHRCDVYFLLP